MDAAEVVAAYAAAWNDGDTERAWSYFADDVVMRLPGRGALAGEHRGREAVLAAIRALLERTSESYAHVDVIDRLVSADRVALVLREAATRGDERLEHRRVSLYRVANGQIVDIDIYEANRYEVDAFFG